MARVHERGPALISSEERRTTTTYTPPADDLPHLFSFLLLGFESGHAPRSREASRDASSSLWFFFFKTRPKISSAFSPDRGMAHRGAAGLCPAASGTHQESNFGAYPRGISPSSILTFETMGWPEPCHFVGLLSALSVGPSVGTIVPRVGERDLASLPRLPGNGIRREVAGETARLKWVKRWFAEEVLFHHLTELLLLGFRGGDESSSVGPDGRPICITCSHSISAAHRHNTARRSDR